MNIETLSHIWTIFVKSNAFNFTIFVLIFIWLGKKFNINSKFEALQQKVVNLIEDAKKTKEEAKQELVEVQKTVEYLPEVLNEMLQDAERSADVISKKILNEAQMQIENIESNAKKVIDAEEKMLIAKLSKTTSVVSVEIAKSHIKNVLAQTPSLQEKYIDQSINELDRLSF